MKFVSAICKSLLFKFEIVSIAPAGSPNRFKEQILVLDINYLSKAL